MPDLLPFRQVSDENIYNLYHFSGGTMPIKAGTVVAIQSGFVSSKNDLEFLGAVGGSVNNTVSQRYTVQPAVRAANTGDLPLGITLYEIRETDENGLPLVFDKRKAIENDWVLSGQAVPIATRGMFLYSGVVGTPTAGAKAYASGGSIIATNPGAGSNPIGQFLGPKDDNNHVLVHINI